jgi:hypothetical protein
MFSMHFSTVVRRSCCQFTFILPRTRLSNIFVAVGQINLIVFLFPRETTGIFSRENREKFPIRVLREENRFLPSTARGLPSHFSHCGLFMCCVYPSDYERKREKLFA